MAELLELSARLIDEGDTSTPSNRVTQELSVIDDGLAVVESFSHLVGLDTGDGLVVVDASGQRTGPAVVEALRSWSTDPVRTLLYTHGHVDHVGGSGALVADGRARGHRDPEVVAHRAVLDRFARYRMTEGWNTAINARQFGGVRPVRGVEVTGIDRFLPDDVAEPDRTYETATTVRVGDELLELHHALGETDDHTWTWLPGRRTVLVGDLLTWVFPNCGNPQKVQRYPLEWAQALRAMAALGPELLVPAHGLPIGGAARIARVLDEVATVLERLVADVVELMNDGADLDTVVGEVRVDPELAGRPYLRATYDEPEFVVRNVWRRYGGWWDGDAATLKPARRSELAEELAALVGGAAVLASRGRELADRGDWRLACHLVELAGLAAPGDVAVHEARAEVYRGRRSAETSLMAKGIYAAAARASARVVGDGP